MSALLLLPSCGAKNEYSIPYEQMPIVPKKELSVDDSQRRIVVLPNVKFTEPFASSAGVIVAVQLGAVPLNTTFATGTSIAFDVAALIDPEQVNVLSTSVIVKFTVFTVSSFVL